MNTKNVKRWIEDLRSGKHKQAKGRLRDGNSFCCLGRACDVFKDEVNGSWDDNVFTLGYNPLSLPLEVANLLGIESKSPKLVNLSLPKIKKLNKKLNKQLGSNYLFLADLNDHGATFSEIADVIEEQLKYGAIE